MMSFGWSFGRLKSRTVADMWHVQRRHGNGALRAWVSIGLYVKRDIAVMTMNSRKDKNLRVWCSETGEVVGKGQK